ncbi:hypothetical protein [Sulfodiicoccus acidiphilus]|uniref:hypothetical protein n=1 Tax=Sulfodiicoccus acidiphilus TaxID=1670455 RepID=UPI000F84E26C|nr:hypothetical protein [Sulfodiicoccus acidiphilus]
MNILRGGKRVLTDSGDVIEISPGLWAELERLSCKVEHLANVVMTMLVEGKDQEDVFTGKFKVPSTCSNYCRVVGARVVTPVDQFDVFISLASFGDVGQVSVSRISSVGAVVSKILGFARKYQCLEIDMDYPYKFIVFEAFNTFRQLYNPTYTGFVKVKEREFMTSVDREFNALLWPVEASKFSYLSEVRMDKDIKAAVMQAI